MRKLILLFSGFLLAFTAVTAQISLPARMWADTTFAPFIYGVASGDPTANSVIIWSALTDTFSTPQSVSWEIATDTGFTAVVQSGTVVADPGNSFTGKVDVQGLQPATYYWYRFQQGGVYSQRGRTKTAPSGSVSHLRFAVASCSSIFSGYFGAYRHIADRNDLDLFIHLGDYIYDTPDPDELIRIPSPAPTQPVTLEDYHTRQQFYLLDPDLRAARQMHPMTVIWDNHDVEDDSVGQKEAAIQSFWEFLPCRMPDSLNPEQVYRTLHYGDLVDIFMTDGHTYRGIDTMPNGAPSYLGETQNTWLEAELAASTSRWKLVGNQKMFGQWSTAGIPGLPIGNGQVADPSSWDGFPESRNRLLDYIVNNQMENFIFLSGDLHLSIADDVCKDPFNAPYDPNTGSGSVAVEFLPTSISRGNFDEFGIPSFLIPGIKAGSDFVNQHHFFTDFTEHGYGILDVKEDSTIAEFWYVDILNPNTGQNLDKSLTVRDGENHWSRGPLVAIEAPELAENAIQIFPNPAKDVLLFRSDLPNQSDAQIEIIEVSSGKIVLSREWPKHAKHQFELDIRELSAGNYLVKVISPGQNEVKRMVKIK